MKSEAGVSATFITPLTGFTLNLDCPSENTPFGTFGVGIDKNGGNGSGNAFYGDLKFDVKRTGGLLVSDFVANSDGWYFSADLTDGRNTGAQAWKTHGTSVPDGGATLALIGLGIAGLGLARRKLS